MKNVLIIGALIALAACSGRADEEPVVEEVVAGDPAENAAGTYQVTNSQGAVLQSVLHEDGTYTDTTDGEIVETGTWTEDDGQVCFTPETQQNAQSQEYCYRLSETSQSGVFEATSAEGETTTVTKVS